MLGVGVTPPTFMAAVSEISQCCMRLTADSMIGNASAANHISAVHAARVSGFPVLVHQRIAGRCPSAVLTIGRMKRHVATMGMDYLSQPGGDAWPTSG